LRGLERGEALSEKFEIPQGIGQREYGPPLLEKKEKKTLKFGNSNRWVLYYKKTTI